MNIDYPFHFDNRGRTADAPDDDHVRDMIEEFLFTNHGERVNRPDFGSGLLQLVFAPNSPELASALQFTIQAGQTIHVIVKRRRLHIELFGQAAQRERLKPLGLDEFGEVFDLNFLGTFVPAKVFGAAMARAGAGSIVNISSMSALTPLTRVAAYSAAKAAVANFTRWLAVHLSHVGVRVNALAPGFFMTEQLRFLHIDSATGEYTPRAKKVIAHTPMGRYGEPEDLLGTVVWLLSGASKFVTGIVVPIDGGFSSYSI